MIHIVRLHYTGEGFLRYSMDHYLKSGSQAIHIQKIFACIGLQHVHLSQKITCTQSGIYLCSPLPTDNIHFQIGKCQ